MEHGNGGHLNIQGVGQFNPLLYFCVTTIRSDDQIKSLLQSNAIILFGIFPFEQSRLNVAKPSSCTNLIVNLRAYLGTNSVKQNEPASGSKCAIHKTSNI